MLGRELVYTGNEGRISKTVQMRCKLGGLLQRNIADRSESFNECGAVL
jgi:hypothetical protein